MAHTVFSPGFTVVRGSPPPSPIPSRFFSSNMTKTEQATGVGDKEGNQGNLDGICPSEVPCVGSGRKSSS